MKYFGPVWLSVATVLTCAAILGCVGRDEDRGSTTDSGAQDLASKGKETSPSGPNSVTVEMADRAAYEEVLAKHKGKVVLVDFWATWCVPCVQQFPHTVELSRKSDPTQLAVVSVSMDEPEDKDSVLQFLQDTGATFDNLISTYGVGQEGFEAFEITDGAVPHYKIYGRTGKLRHIGSSNEEIDQVVQQLLIEP